MPRWLLVVPENMDGLGHHFSVIISDIYRQHQILLLTSNNQTIMLHYQNIATWKLQGMILNSCILAYEIWKMASEFTNLKYSRVEIDEVRFEWAECMLDYIRDNCTLMC
ncbi:uncharacterized protein LOC122024692 [Zingiber officinale]|uniref:uncharacterized protein LOC122024692 n=1 Tax=Zingiber officinale TaxID=94328 RepID=UPI001C4D8480|nr:uncharacterized protein LOC122024692 [Zingiber officinale]